MPAAQTGPVMQLRQYRVILMALMMPAALTLAASDVGDVWDLKSLEVRVAKAEYDLAVVKIDARSGTCWAGRSRYTWACWASRRSSRW